MFDYHLFYLAGSDDLIIVEAVGNLATGRETRNGCEVMVGSLEEVFELAPDMGAEYLGEL